MVKFLQIFENICESIVERQTVEQGYLAEVFTLPGAIVVAF